MQQEFQDVSPEYKAFVEKFKPKKTTDDCYTPENIYKVILDWVRKEYNIGNAPIVRPFWPGGDYLRAEYPAGCVVVDNPPFSILAQVVRFYMANGIRFFLFAPALTNFTAPESGAKYVCAHCTITYANGAEVVTGFVTSEGDYIVRTAPDLHKLVKEADDANLKQICKQQKKLALPIELLTAARAGWMSVHGTEFRVKVSDCAFVRKLDNYPAGIFGGGFLLNKRAAAERAAAERAAAERAVAERAAAERAAAERAAAERAAAERAAAERVHLSPRELKIMELIEGKNNGEN